MKRFGIIGLGTIAKGHADAIESLPDCQFVAGYHNNLNKAETFCSSYSHAKAYNNLDEFLNNASLDIVTIATPSGYHLEYAIKAIEAKKHIIIEKPLEITTERCNLIIKKAKENGVIAAGIFQSRFFEAPKLVKSAIDKGKFGILSICDAQVKWFRSQEYYDSAGWRGTWALDGGGALMNQSIHAIDLLLWLCGPVDEVTAYTALRSHTGIEVEDTATAILKFRNGALGVIEGTTSSYPGFLKKIDICGSKGSASIEEENLVKYQFVDETEEDKMDFERLKNVGTSEGVASDPGLISYKSHAMVFEDVVKAIDEGREPLINATEAKKPVELIEAIYLSAKEKRPVKLPL
ncbi:MAG: Gfo/Idh/MocA family oxidoreductase [Spirochaetaceae bacterium]|nr:Gfo/Idh/MocA family oxidoreductase [Spirochaetaceae bacterium]